MKIKRSLIIKIISVVLAVVAFEFILYSSYNVYFSPSAGENTMPEIFQQVDDIPFPYTGTNDNPMRTAYSHLGTEDLKKLYEAIGKSVYSISSEANNDGKYDTLSVYAGNKDYSEKDIYTAATAYFDDNPQVFWCDKSIECVYSEKDGAYVSAFSFYPIDDINSMSRKLSHEVLRIVNEAPAVTDHYYVEKYVHDDLVENCKYMIPQYRNGLASTSYGCLVNNNANCEGITDGFNLVMKCLGYETLKIYGYTQQLGLHTWSCIKLGKEWYMTDVTWDLREGGHRYDYFNMSTNEISKTHNIERTYDKVEEYNISLELANKFFNVYVPKCSDLNQSYFARESYAVTKESDIYKNKYLLEYIHKACKSGFDYCSLKISADRVSVDKIVEKMFSDENIEYYNTNMKYRLNSGENFVVDTENYEIIEDLNVIILRFNY